MSNELTDELIAISSEIKDQLQFYREMGFEDLGGSGVTAELAPAADSRHSQPQSQNEEVLSRQPAQSADASLNLAGRVEQVDLFGEIIAGPRKDAAPKSHLMPVVESPDESLDAIRDDLGDCTRCKLHEHRRTIVFGEGNPQASLVFVGEGPGAEEDATGRPFVGRAGQLLDKIIAAIGLRREDVYIANIVKCRPPLNRTPERDEVETCEPFLFRQIKFIRPRVIVALGSPAFQTLLRTRESITRARGEWHELDGIRVMPTFHPAFLLRSPDKKREVWEDMKKVRDFLNAN
jgi:uracil-DNA glycosylase family 4